MQAWAGIFPSHPQPQFSLPRNLEIEYYYYCGAINITYLFYMLLDTSICVIKMLFETFVPDCNLRGSKFKVFLGGEGIPPHPPPLKAHTHASMCKRAFHMLLSSCYHPVPSSPPTQNLV